MSSVATEWDLPTLEGPTSAANSYGVVPPFVNDEPKVKLGEFTAETWIPLFEPGFGSASTIAVSTVTMNGTMRISRESASEGASLYSRNMWERLTLLADALEAEAAPLSTVRRLDKSPRFAKLEASGTGAIEIALKRLNGDRRPVWLYFLQHSTHVRVARGEETIEGAATAWLAWGARTGLL
jgi:hypothetical protein